MSFVSKEIRRFGYIVVNGVQVLAAQYHFECDSQTDLPTQTQFQNDKNVFLFMGSTAHTIDTDKKYELTSAGTWIEQSQPWQPLADYDVLSHKPQINSNTLTGNQTGADLGLQNTLTFDSTPTQNSTNPVTSGGVWTDQQRQETEIGVVANAGAKNLLPMTHAGGSITRYGVTCTWDLNAGTMTLNGTHNSGDGTAIFEFYGGKAENTTILPAGSYTLTGCPAGGSTSTYRAVLMQIAGAVDAGNGVSFGLSEPHYAAYRILISGNVTFNNMVFKPMIRPAAITDATFQPYAPTNRELYEMILALQ